MALRLLLTRKEAAQALAVSLSHFSSTSSLTFHACIPGNCGSTDLPISSAGSRPRHLVRCWRGGE